MTGTSLDAIDVACVEIRGRGLEIQPRLIRHVSTPLGTLADRLRALASQQPHSAGKIATTAHEFSLAVLAAIAATAENLPLRLAAIHGQTIFHAPPVSWQLLQPALIAHGLQTDVVFDLRAADLAAGGQGAPITPMADWVLFRSATETRTVVNLGGFCNFTHLPVDSPPSSVTGGDICLCNQLLDAIARRFLGRPYDEEGRLAVAGICNEGMLREITAHLARQARSGRSLGSRDESSESTAHWFDACSPADLARTACEAVAATIATTLPRTDRILLAGGGARNPVLTQAIQRRCSMPCEPTDCYRVPIEARESVEMAVLGALCEDRIAITLPQITGARTTRVAGAWVFGSYQPPPL